MAAELKTEALEKQLESMLDIEKFLPRGLPQARAHARRIPLRGGRARPRGVLVPPGGGADRLGGDAHRGPRRVERPFYKWFADGKLNVSHNCLDRHIEAGNGDRIAYHWRGEEGEERDITYADLHRDVQRCANALKDRGIGKGDVVGIYLPMIPEVVIAMLACARIGAPTTSSSAASPRRPSASGWSSPRPRP